MYSLKGKLSIVKEEQDSLKGKLSIGKGEQGIQGIQGIQGEKGDIGDNRVKVSNDTPVEESVEVWFDTSDLESGEELATKDYVEATNKEINDRVNNIISHNGDGTKDTELIDARCGSPTLGEKIRGISSSLEEVNAEFAQFKQEVDIRVENVEAAVENINNILGGKTGKRYGVRFYKNSSNSAGERLGDAVGLVANVGVGNEMAVNDFDDIYPWGYRRVCNLNHDGTVLAYEGDPTFRRDGSNGDVMVETPIFYQKYVETEEYIEYWIADYFAPGYRVSPRFKTKEGKVLKNDYIGAYKASLVDNNLVSRSGAFPRVEAGRHTFRNWAKAKGAGWGLTDIAYRCDIESYLFYIEFATRNSQALMQGLTTFQWDYKTTAETMDNNTLTLDSNNICVGFTLRVNNIDRRVIETDSVAKTVVVEGEPFSVAAGTTISSRAWINGETDGVKASSGSMLSNSNGKNCCKYRGVENPWGNIWEWIDGCNIKDWQAYTHWIPDEYGDDIFAEPYVKLGYINADVSGYITEMGYDENTPYVQMPTKTGGSSATHFADYYYQNTGNRAPLAGAYLSYGADAGLSYWRCDSGFTTSGRTFGARLSYKSS